MKDVHTEHCCWVHGCKYSDPDCTVTTNQAKQSYPCEECPDPKKLVYKIRNKDNGLFKRKGKGAPPWGWNEQGDVYRSAGMARAAAKYSKGPLEIVAYVMEEYQIIPLTSSQSEV